MSTPEHRVPPSSSSDPETSTGAAARGASEPGSAGSTGSAPATHDAPATAGSSTRGSTSGSRTSGDTTDRIERTPPATSAAFPVAEGPRTTSVGGHLLGILGGLLLTLLALFLVTLGQSRILAEGVGRSDITPDVLGIVLVALGALVAAGVVLLGLRTPAAPLTGGLLAVIIGAAYLFAPVEAHSQSVSLLVTEQNRTAVLNSITVATTGGVFVIGVVLLAVATALSLVRRRGVALGAFRERSHS